MDDVQNIIEQGIDHFEDIYHQYGDDHDEDQDRYVDFDNFDTMTGQDNETDDADIYGYEEHQNLPVKRMDVDPQPLQSEVAQVIIKQEPTDEEHLSQKFSQLSASDPMEIGSTSRKRPSMTPTKDETTSTATKTENPVKKLKVAEEDMKTIEWLRTYLSTSNKRFQSTVQPALKLIQYAVLMDEIQQVATILHQLKALEFDKLLWNKYLESGTGELMQQESIRSVLVTHIRLPTLQYWPLDVKQRMIKRGETTIEDPQKIEHDKCLDYVQRVLHKFDQQIQYYQSRFRSIRKRLGQRFNEHLESIVTDYVRDYGINLYRMLIEKQMLVVEYDYKDRLMVMEFHRQAPNDYQRTTFRELFELKRAAEQAKMDVAILKHRITYKQLPRSFEVLRIPTSIQFESVRNNRVRQRLKDQCEKILQRTTSEFILVSITIADGIFEDAQSKFDRELTIMQRNQNREEFYERFTPKQMDILNKRFRTLDERLMALFNLKLRFFAKAPTDTN